MPFQRISDMMRRFGGRGFSSLSETNPSHAAFVRKLQREMKRHETLSVPLKQLELTVFDFETTGFWPDKGDVILSIGAIKVRNGECTDDTFYSTVLYEEPLAPEIAELTGLTHEELLDSPAIKDVLASFLSFVGTDVLVAHHAGHEKRFMEAAFLDTWGMGFKRRIVDTMWLARLAYQSAELTTLDECCQAAGIEIEHRHHALEDAKVTATLWCNSVSSFERGSVRTLQDVYEQLGMF
ncbi:exonuclease domain-containing protein [Aureibacillus halotolerans]|uniref:DNA polymerase-3 subunit epsilon n=1 Tax=Aureibacillus halotolerans TaxID=1508390 RepID=A0A4R6TZI1_9BACI|nr:exonuclease domain-containing protein [Aureibacillus halotolerans]TDQ37479.1 DNA polymerase-3 subunit epsilon [Aureibacillus halotolerans]